MTSLLNYIISGGSSGKGKENNEYSSSEETDDSDDVNDSDNVNDSDDSDYEQENIETNDDEHPILGKIVIPKRKIFNNGDNIETELRIVNGRNFVNNIPPYEFNRIENQEHITNLKECLDVDNPHFLDPFSVGIIKNDENVIKLMDGHHRHNALDKKLEDNPNFNMTILVNVYYFEDEESFEKTFKKINNKRNINKEDIPDEIIKRVSKINEKRVEKWYKR